MGIEQNQNRGSISTGVVDTADDRRLIREQQAQYQAASGIESKGLTVVYRNGNRAVEDATFSIPQATICALVGLSLIHI